MPNLCDEHACVDKVVSSILGGAMLIKALWKKHALPCTLVKSEGLDDADATLWALVHTLEEYISETVQEKGTPQN